MLQIIDTGSSSAQENMALDTRYLESLEKDPILHLYDWKENSLTYGYFIQLDQHINRDALARYKIESARRPTGGGIVFHVWDYAFSFLMPSSHPFFSINSLDNYQFVNALVLKAVQDVFSLDDSVFLTKTDFLSLGEGCQNFCMAKPTQYDVVYRGMKVAGAAQRRTKKGYLHQGMISLGLPQEGWLQDLLISKESVAEAMRSYTFAPLRQNYSAQDLCEARSLLAKALSIKFAECL